MDNNILEYKGYFSKIQYSSKDNIIFGVIEGIADLITFESSNCSEIQKEFQMAVDDYLEFCKEVGKSPEKPYKGSFNIRISPELHKRADITAKKRNISLNQFVSDAIENYLDYTDNKTIIYYPVFSQNWNTSNFMKNYSSAYNPKYTGSEVKLEWKM